MKTTQAINEIKGKKYICDKGDKNQREKHQYNMCIIGGSLRAKNTSNGITKRRIYEVREISKEGEVNFR